MAHSNSMAIAAETAFEETAVAELEAALRGPLIRPADAVYDDVRRIWNGSIDRRPAVIARCTGVADVIAAVKFARQTGIEVAIRSGGHSFPGLSTADDALMIDLSPMRRSSSASPFRPGSSRTPVSRA